MESSAGSRTVPPKVYTDDSIGAGQVQCLAATLQACYHNFNVWVCMKSFHVVVPLFEAQISLFNELAIRIAKLESENI